MCSQFLLFTIVTFYKVMNSDLLNTEPLLLGGIYKVLLYSMGAEIKRQSVHFIGLSGNMPVR